MSLQHESNTVQTVNPTEESPPRMTILSERLSVIFEKMKAAMVKSRWILFLQTVSKWLLGLSLILAVSVFTYVTLYISLMPSEVQLTNTIIIMEAVIVAGFRSTKRTSTFSSASALTDLEPAVIPTWASRWTRGDTSWWWGSPTPSPWSSRSRTLLTTRSVAGRWPNSVLPHQFHPGARDVHVLSGNVRERRRTIISNLSLQSSPLQVRYILPPPHSIDLVTSPHLHKIV